MFKKKCRETKARRICRNRCRCRSTDCSWSRRFVGRRIEFF